MHTKLYWFALSHPAMAARRMLELKDIPFTLVNVLPGSQRIYLRLAGFHEGTVPALKMDGRRIQGSLRISRALDAVPGGAPLFPAAEPLRACVEEAESWGERELQDTPRVLIRWGLVREQRLRRWLATQSGMPMASLSSRASVPVARYYARAIGADEQSARRALERLPALLEHADTLLDDGIISSEAPNAASLQILSSLRALAAFSDLGALLAGHPSGEAARSVFPDFPEPLPGFIPPAWLPTRAASAS